MRISDVVVYEVTGRYDGPEFPPGTGRRSRRMSTRSLTAGSLPRPSPGRR